MLLEIKNLDKSFGKLKAVDNCSFNVGENTITSLIGPNGAGKSTVFNIINSLSKPDSGIIYFKGEPITELETYQIARLGITRTFQLIRLFPKLTVLENLMLAKRFEGEKLRNLIFKPRTVKNEEKSNKELCQEFLKIVGLQEKQHLEAGSLSYGQQKLLEIARALATEADLIMLDEPVAGVNPVLGDKIKNVLLKLKKHGKTILLIDHDMKFVMSLSDKIIVLDQGHEIAEGKPAQIKKNPRVLEAYLGKKVRL